MLQWISALPDNVVNNIFTTINTLICGLIVAFFTSTFLKKKEERTRIAGVIVEKRINSEQDILHYLEQELFKMEMTIENSSKYDVGMVHLLEAYGLPDPYHGQIQYARVFQNRKQFDQFFHGLEDKYAFHKLWLDTKVREHLAFMLIYFGYFNTIPLMVKRIPLPVGQELTDEEMETVCNQILFILGASFDGEMNQLMSELDERIVDSVYKLDLNRPKKSMMRKNMDNMDMKYCMKRLSTRTVLGKSQENIFRLIIDIVYKEKNIDESKMSDQEYDDFIKSAAPKVYDEIKSDIEAFDQKLQQFAKDNGIKKGKLSEGDLPDEGYSITLRELLEGKEPISNTERKKRMGQ